MVTFQQVECLRDLSTKLFLGDCWKLLISFLALERLSLSLRCQAGLYGFPMAAPKSRTVLVLGS